MNLTSNVICAFNNLDVVTSISQIMNYQPYLCFQMSQRIIYKTLFVFFLITNINATCITSGDGILDMFDYDCDNDGILDQFDNDYDNDGILNQFDFDNDNDGILNQFDFDADNDGILNQFDFDADNDGILNQFDYDMR